MPDISKLEDLCRTLDITLEDLLGTETRTAAAAEKAVRESPLTAEELAEVAPILPPETMKAQAKASGRNYNIAALSEIARFLDESVLEEIVEELDVESLTLLACIAPFLSEKTLDKLVRRAPAGDFDGIGAMAPFLSGSTLDYLVEHCEGKPEDWAFFDSLLPFLSETTLDRLVEKYRHDLAGSMIQSLAPFLSQRALDSLAEEKISQGNTEGLYSLYPFLSQQTMKKLAEFLMESGQA